MSLRPLPAGAGQFPLAINFEQAGEVCVCVCACVCLGGSFQLARRKEEEAKRA